MDKIYKFFTAILLFCGCFTLLASETVTFTWEAGSEEKKFFIEVTSVGEKVTVDWGDGSVYTYTMQSMGTNWTYTYQMPGTYNVTLTNEDGSFLSVGIQNQKLVAIDISGLNNLEWASFRENNKLEAITMGNNSHIEQLMCMDNNLTTLNLSSCVNLTSLGCSNNSLSSLIIGDNMGNIDYLNITCKYNNLTYIDLSNIVSAYYTPQLICSFNKIEKIILPEKSLNQLFCTSNKLPLSELYYLYQNVNGYYKALGTQTLDTVSVLVNEWVAVDSVFHGSGTNHVVKLDGMSAVEDEDYYYMEGNFMFMKLGTYRIETSNPLIGSDTKVISFFNVIELGISKSEANTVFAYPNPTTGEVNIKGLEDKHVNIVVYDVFGKNVYSTKNSKFNISHLPKGVYVININNNITKLIKQ